MKRREALALTEELLRATFLEMFGDPVANPKGWPTRSVRSMCESVQYGTSEKANEERRGIAILRMNNLSSIGRIDMTDIKWVELPDDARESLQLKHGDVLFNRTNSPELVGKTAMWRDDTAEFPAVFAGYLIRLRTDEEQVLPDYLAAAMNMPGTKRVLRSIAKVAINMANISASDLDRITLAQPPRDRQIAFRDAATAILREEKKLSTSEPHLDALFASLQHRAFRGEL